MTPYVEKALFREGILKPGPFTQSYILRCYEPSDRLKPFVEHYFISRRRHEFDPGYVGHDVLSQPVVSLFFKPEGAYFEGPTTGKRTLVAKDSPIYIGVQFRPGGFYPFWRKQVQVLAEKTIPAAEVLPDINNKFIQDLLTTSDDQRMVASMEALLLDQNPQVDPHIELLNSVIAYIEDTGGMTTVASTADRFGTSERTLQHLFRVYVGVGIKWAIMRVRFLGVIQFAREQENPDWTAIAAEFGYSDQSHFTNDFKKLIGVAPSRFMVNAS